VPTVRIYLLTYRRNHLLPRALASLCGQTFTNWECELHNDDPADRFPGTLVTNSHDSRIKYVHHETNLGPNRTFNLVFQPCDNDYVCLLEDDNWWEPTFLEEMIGLLEANPKIDVAWANMNVWREHPDQSWTQTAQTIWPTADFKDATLFPWPHFRHLDSLVHSNGSALIRNRNLSNLIVPKDTPFLAMEPIRERAMRFPLLFCPHPLVNFAWTQTTHRESSSVLAGQMKALLTASYLRHAHLDKEGWRQLAERARQSPVNELAGLLIAAHLADLARPLARHVRAMEWPRIIASWIRHPTINFQLFRSSRDHRAISDYLDLHTARRFAESAPR
jgi:GT2 family glycosyltransferase